MNHDMDNSQIENALALLNLPEGVNILRLD